MKRYRMVLVVVGCLATLFVGWLSLAARWTKMDATTMRMPMGLRRLVAQTELKNIPWPREDSVRLRRVVRIDPDSVDGWDRLCRVPIEQASTHTTVEACQKATTLENDRFWTTEGLLGDAETADGNSCAAENAYGRAAALGSPSSWFAQRKGLAALSCGHLSVALASFEAAFVIDERDIKGRVESPNVQNIRESITLDHEYLSVFWARQGDQAKAQEECRLAMPGNKSSCTCKFLDKFGTLTNCTGEDKLEAKAVS